MAQMNLTEGSIAMFSSGSDVGDIQPVLQVADVRLVSTQNPSSNERYRILLSDGSFTQQGMLATQLNDLVRSQKLQKGSIIKLKQFVCNVIQNRMIVIIVNLEVIAEKCDLVGEPKPYPTKNDGNASSIRKSSTSQPMNQPAVGVGNPPSYGGAGSATGGSAPRPSLGGGIPVPSSGEDRNAGLHSYGNSYSTNMDSGRYNTANAVSTYPKPEYGSGVSRAPLNNYVRPPQSSYNQPPQSSYNQPPPMYANRGPVARNEAPPRIIPIAALNPYQGRWTIKARVTSKGDLRLYNNSKGDGKVFSFDLLDSDGGEIRVTCFNAVADQFYPQIEPGRIYMISKGTLKPSQKNFNHLRNDHEIFLDNSSTVQPCFEDDKSIPQQQFHFRPICDIEGLENNSVVDFIGVVTSISPSSSLMRKNGTETQKRTLQLKDMSGRSVELTLWGNFSNAEGQTLQSMCDSGIFPVLAVKSGRVSDFNGKSVGTISNSQLLIEPDFPETHKLKTWFENDGKITPAISISRDSGITRSDVRKTISQIKDEKLGTSEKPDWITVSATIIFIKVDSFCYTACPIMIGDRQCNKKVIDNGDGKWRCDRCDQIVDECDFRYILQMEIQDHTGQTRVTAFQESGEEIMGISAKELYNLKHEEQGDEKFAELVRNVLFTKFLFKLKVKEETFSDEQRVKSTVVKAEKVNLETSTRSLLDLIAKFKEIDSGSLPPKSENVIPKSTAPAMNYIGTNSNVASQVGSYGNQYGGCARLPSTGNGATYMSCNSCGGTGHNSANCPSLMSGPGQSYGSSNVTPGVSAGGASSECYKCHQFGHWARDCPGSSTSNVPSAYGSNNLNPGASAGGASGECFKCHQTGHWARDCPGGSIVPPAYGSSNVTPGRYGMVPNQRVGGF
ncbi:hypothetical protein RD792_001560 [Penstemon davidsonii]|uniref:Replication protein A subunit n=1 Tax=Penstemon davidsonii TaxID=160366 RepID=A0ABR0DNQ0_9LAMI|nr:hypothetical protein RD792_001560 [Penstemon davidsonii]